MKIETTVTLTPEELNKYVADGMKADGEPLSPSAQLTVVIEKAPPDLTQSAPSAQFMASAAPIWPKPLSPSAQSPSTAPIGKVIGDGYHVTHYGYPGDSSPDSNSMKGIGDRGNKLTPNVSVALNKLAREKLFPGAPLSPSTGRQITAFANPELYWQDDDSAPEIDVPRIDVYDPYYIGRDIGNTDEMFAKSKSEMIAAGILKA